MTSTTENYLKAILMLGTRKEAEVGLGKIAERVGVTAGTVTTMMRQLEGRGLIEYRPRYGVKLTTAGRREATAVVRRHRVIELFLVKVMSLTNDEVHEEAEVLEHVVSERLLERMDEMLGYPEYDPHGEVIPDAEGKLPIGREIFGDSADVRSASPVDTKKKSACWNGFNR